MTDPVRVDWLVVLIVPVVLLVFQLAMSVGVGLIIWQFKDFRKWIRETLAGHDAKIEKNHDDLQDFKVTVAKEYVSRDDFRESVETIRGDVVAVMTTVDKKLDRIGRALTQPDPGA